MTIPAVLYKYRSLSDESSQRFTRSILVDGALYFASPRELNDPFEGRFAISFDEKTRSELTEMQLYAEKHLADHVRETIGIFSLTPKCDNILMWSHYADSHRGICIGFNTTGESGFFQAAQPVIYSSEFLVLGAHKPSIKGRRELLALTKYKQWDYEAEWRIIDQDSGSGVRNFPKSHIASIILGNSVSAQSRQIILEWIDQSGCILQLFEARLNSKNYTIEIRPVVA